MANQDNDVPEQTPDELFRTAVIFEAALGGVAIVLGLVFGPDARGYVPRLEDQPWRELGEGVGYGLLAAIPMWAFITIVRRLPLEAVRKLERLGDEALFQSLMKLSVVEMIIISLAAGVGEELLFRGWLLPAMASWLSDLDPMFAYGIAAIASSVAFGLVHPMTKLYVFLAAIIGLYLAGLMLLTGNLLIPIVAHATYDAIQMIAAKYSGRDDSGESSRLRDPSEPVDA